MVSCQNGAVVSEEWRKMNSSFRGGLWFFLQVGRNVPESSLAASKFFGSILSLLPFHQNRFGFQG
jgi:hypothetical protein